MDRLEALLSPNSMKPAVITPYHQESLKILERCHHSVRAQLTDATHILVADGNSRSAIDQWIVNIWYYLRNTKIAAIPPRALGVL